MTTIGPTPKFTAYDDDGTPMVGGLLYTYEAGTTTPRASYTDATGSTTNSNPIVLDVRGECDLWMTPATAYKLVLRDSLSNLIWTVDSITAAGTMSLQDASAVDITGGTISGVTFAGNAANVTGTVAIANGGTGAITEVLARAALGAAAAGANTDITSLAATATVNSQTIGYRSIPSNAQTAAYQITADDNGKCIDITTGGITIPSNAALALPVGFTFSVYNDSGSNQTIAITTDTMYLSGTATTGSRTLAQRGFATFSKRKTTTWAALGAGLT